MAASLLAKLKSTYETITVHDGAKHNFLGMTFDYSVDGKCTVDMPGYVEDIISTYRVQKTAKTPASVCLFDIDDKSPRLDKERSERFHSATAKLLYLALRSRPDMLTAVSFLTTRVQQPTEQDEGKLDRVLAYLKGSKDLNLTFEPDKHVSILASIDASHGVHADGKGHTGGTYWLGRGALFSQSSKQRIVSKSSSETELIAVSDFFSNIIRAREFLIEQGYKVGPATLLQDNQSTIKLMHRGRAASDRTRHIAIRYFFIKDRIDSNEIRIEYCPTDKMVADILTKPLVGMRFFRHRHELLNLPGTLDRRDVLVYKD